MPAKLANDVYLIDIFTKTAGVAISIEIVWMAYFLEKAGTEKIH